MFRFFALIFILIYIFQVIMDKPVRQVLEDQLVPLVVKGRLEIQGKTAPLEAMAHQVR